VARVATTPRASAQFAWLARAVSRYCHARVTGARLADHYDRFGYHELPGKFELEKWVVTRKGVLKAVNWIRKKSHHPPLQAP
jgi:hypothetical protein